MTSTSTAEARKPETAEHTPGPWTVRKDGNSYRIVSSQGLPVASVPIDLADAHMLAAAPELLEALKWARSVYRPDADSDMVRAMDAAVRILRGIDRWELEDALSTEEWHEFCTAPADFFLRTDDANAQAIWAVIEKRMRR